MPLVECLGKTRSGKASESPRVVQVLDLVVAVLQRALKLVLQGAELLGLRLDISVVDLNLCVGHGSSFPWFAG